MERVALVSVNRVKIRTGRRGQWSVMADEVKAVLARARAGEGAVVAIPGETALWRAKEHLTRRLSLEAWMLRSGTWGSTVSWW